MKFYVGLQITCYFSIVVLNIVHFSIVIVLNIAHF